MYSIVLHYAHILYHNPVHQPCITITQHFIIIFKINSLKLEYTMIALTETWLDQSKQDLYNMPKYNCINRFRKQRRGGGVSLYIKNDIKFMNRPDLEYFDAEMESLFIEIDKNVFNLSSNVIVGVIYRMPNTCMEIFNDRMSDIINIVTVTWPLTYGSVSVIV